MPRSRMALLLAVAALVNTLPFFFFDVGGDHTFQLVLIQCFAGQFWQGDWSPHWCFSANAGLGSPVFFFYYRLPFYIASLFYPITWLGANVSLVYALSCFCATWLTGYTATIWLGRIVSPKRALLAAVLLLFMPYRLEALFARSAYSEAWCMALLPLLFHYTRRLARHEGGAAGVALTVAAMALCHLPCTGFGCLFSGLYMLVMTGRFQKNHAIAIIGSWSLSMLSGLALTAFYLFPFLYFQRYIKVEGMVEGDISWPNTFLNAHNLYKQTAAVVLIAIALFAFVALASYILANRRRIADPFIRAETQLWIGLMALAFVLLVPLSAPLYRLSAPLSHILFPWRVQAIFMVGMAYLSAIFIEWMLSKRRQRNGKRLYGTVLVVLMLLSCIVFSQDIEDDTHHWVRLRSAQIIFQPEYTTQWTYIPPSLSHFAKEDYLREKMLAREADKAAIPPLIITHGEGDARVQRWAWDGITIATHAVAPMQLRLDHYYFPNWTAQTEQGNALPLHPEEGSGQMLLDVPAGTQVVTLHQSILAPNAGLIYSGWGVSILGGIIIGWFVVAKRQR